jgi:hypothetical protein
VLLVNQWFVNWWVTGKQYGGFLLTAAILLNILVRHWNTTAGYSVFCFGYQRRISLTNLSDGLVTAAASVGLITWLGPVGAPLGSVLGACMVSLPCNLRVIARDTGVTVLHLVKAMVSAWSWRFAIVAGAVWWVGVRWSPRNLPEAVIAVASITILYGLIMLPNVFRSPLGMYIRPLLSSFRVKYAALQMRFSS